MYNELEVAFSKTNGVFFTFQYIHRKCYDERKALSSDNALAWKSFRQSYEQAGASVLRNGSEE